MKAHKKYALSILLGFLLIMLGMGLSMYGMFLGIILIAVGGWLNAYPYGDQ